MRARLPILLLFFAGSLAPRAQEPPAPERWYPLNPGDEWVYQWRDCTTFQKNTTCDPYFYLEQRVVGDTLLAGEPYALVSFERFTLMGDPLAAALAAVRVVPDPPAPSVELNLLQGSAEALEGGFGSWCGERPLPLEEGDDDTVTIGGLPYALTVAEVSVDCSGASFAASEDATFALDLGMVGAFGHAHVFASSTDDTRGSTLVYADVGGVVYGIGNPVASEPPTGAPAGFAVEAVYPNPFRGSAAVAFTLPAPAAVTVAAYDALGRRVLVRDLGALPARTPSRSAGRNWRRASTSSA